jgi:hypothetical protein
MSPDEPIQIGNNRQLFVDEIDSVVRWASNTDLAGRSIRLVFAIIDADVYAVRFR